MAVLVLAGCVSGDVLSLAQEHIEKETCLVQMRVA